MKRVPSDWLAALALAALSSAMTLALGAVVWASLDAAARVQVQLMLEPWWPALGFTWLAMAFLLGMVGAWLWRKHGVASARVNELLMQQQASKQAWDAQLHDAVGAVAHERERLAALMSELPQSVVVCNRDGLILLYNQRARLQLQGLTMPLAKPGGASEGQRGGQGLVGLGRSIYAVLDRHAVAHALDSLGARMAHGAAHPRSQFIATTRAGHLMRVQLAPVRGTDEPLAGFIVMVESVSRNLMRRPLEPMQGADLLNALAQRLKALDAWPVTLSPVDRALWLSVDSYSLVDAMVGLALRLRDTLQARAWQLSLVADDGAHAWLALRWDGEPLGDTQRDHLETQPMALGDGTTLPYSLRDVRQRHAGRWGDDPPRSTLPNPSDEAHVLRLRLPATEAAESAHHDEMARATEARPAFYDFDLFRASAAATTWLDRPLTELTYTVFDTETTGLQPSAGDEIIQIGAARIVAGKLRANELFDQLIDPQRSLPKASTAIHGITGEMVKGQPTIDAVLPRFHAFAQDAVLVAHNAAFDLKFLQLKEARTGVRFDAPVLDTLLLSSLLQPEHTAHSLEAMAQRLGVPVLGRHTALGDALVTAEVFLRLLPLLKAQGIVTLGQALDASKLSRYARVNY